jgi:hypothetical protein
MSASRRALLFDPTEAPPLSGERRRAPLRKARRSALAPAEGTRRKPFGEAGPHLRSASGSKAGSSEEPACPSKCLRTEAAREVLAPLLSASPTLPVACSASLSHDPPEKVRRALLDKNRSASEEHHAPPRRGAAPVALNPSPEGKGRPHFSEGVVSRPTPSPFGESGRGGSGSGDLLISQQKSLN